MTLKKFMMVGIVCFVLASGGLAQDQNKPQGFSAAFSLMELAENFGIGLEVQSPLFFNAAAVQIEAKAFWLNAPESSELWYPFLAVRAGLVGYPLTQGGIMRLYGYGGVELVLTSLWTDYIDAEQFRFGGFGGFGFEFFFVPQACYYIELGSTGSAAVTRYNQRLYRNGFETIVGLRWYF